MKNLPRLLRATGAALILTTFAVAAQAEDQTIRIGVTGGPHAQIMETVKKVAAAKHLDVKVIEFSDYIQPNAALAAGDLDLNSYQHQPYLDAQVADRGYKFTSVGQTITFPMGLYSKQYKKLSDLPAGSRIGVPNDPTNGGRGLLLLEAAGLIKLKPDAGLKATPLDIISNPRKLKILEIDAAQLPRSLEDVAAAAINGNYAESAGLNPIKDAIYRENAKGPYANVLVVRTADKDKPWVKTFVDAYHSPEVKTFVKEKFKDSVITAW